MKKTFLMFSMALLAVVACQKQQGGRNNNDNKKDNVDVVIDDVKLEGEGKLVYIDPETKTEINTNSSYKWSATEENGIQVEINVDTKQYIEGDGTEEGVPGGAFQIGTFFLPLADIGEFLGVAPTETLTPDNFAPVCDYLEGASGWTSYMPGMWLNNDGLGCGWGDGTAFWQWYIWGGKTFTIGEKETTVGYDISDDGNYDNWKGLLFLGGNPNNSKTSGGKTIKSHNVMKIGKDINFDITFKFGPYEAPVDQSEAVTELTGETVLKQLDDLSVEIEGTKLAWNITKDAITFNAELSMSAMGMELAENSETEYVGGPWAVGCVKFDLSIFTDIIGMDIATTDLTTFYPCNAEGVAYDKWTSYAPGQWFTPEGEPAAWDTGHCYWWFAVAKSSEGEPIGSFVVGNGPMGSLHTVGLECHSYNKLNGIPFNVNIKYVE